MRRLHAAARAKRGARHLLSFVFRILLLCLGTALFAVAVEGFYKPNVLLSGGVTGTSLLINRFTGFPVGLGVLLFNIPVFLLGFRDVGRRFALLSATGVGLFWLLVDFVPIAPLTQEPMLAAIFGGVLAGLGSSLAIRAGGSLGGFDILGVVVNRRFSTGVGEVLMTLNGILVLAAGLFVSPETAMYTLIAIYASGRTVDLLQTPRPRKAFLVMTRSPSRIRERIISEMGRGLTVLRAEGGFDGEDLTVLLCVVTRMEVRELSEIVKEEDRHAFTAVLEASEVLGSFRRPSAYQQLRRLQVRSPDGQAPPGRETPAVPPVLKR